MKTTSAKPGNILPTPILIYSGWHQKNKGHWFPARSYNFLALGFGMLRSWKLHPTPIITLSQLSFLIISVLFEKLLWPPSCLPPPWSWVSGVTGFCFYLFEIQGCSQFPPIDFIQYLNCLNSLNKGEIWWLSDSVYVHFKRLAMLPTHKSWLKRHLKWSKTIPRMLQNSYFTCMKVSSQYFLLTFKVTLLHKAWESPFFLPLFLARLAFQGRLSYCTIIAGLLKWVHSSNYTFTCIT